MTCMWQEQIHVVDFVVYLLQRLTLSSVNLTTWYLSAMVRVIMIDGVIDTCLGGHVLVGCLRQPWYPAAAMG